MDQVTPDSAGPTGTTGTARSDLDTARVGDVVHVNWGGPMCDATDPDPDRPGFHWHCTREPHTSGQHLAVSILDNVVQATWPW